MAGVEAQILEALPVNGRAQFMDMLVQLTSVAAKV